MFEVHAENELVCGNMDLMSALSFLLHLCFALDLEYPKESETVYDIIQRLVAKYGDDRPNEKF